MNASHPGAAIYYDSLASLFIDDWGLDFVKFDCMLTGWPALRCVVHSTRSHARRVLANKQTVTTSECEYALAPLFDLQRSASSSLTAMHVCAARPAQARMSTFRCGTVRSVHVQRL